MERILGPDHPDTLNSRNRLANAYRDAGRSYGEQPKSYDSASPRDIRQNQGYRP
jgi:hypothetical protein